MSLNQGIKDWIYDKMSRYVMFSSHVMPTWACARAGIYKSLMCRHRHLIFIDGIQWNHHVMNVFDVSCQGNHIGIEDI